MAVSALSMVGVTDCGPPEEVCIVYTVVAASHFVIMRVMHLSGFMPLVKSESQHRYQHFSVKCLGIFNCQHFLVLQLSVSAFVNCQHFLYCKLPVSAFCSCQQIFHINNYLVL